MNTKLTLVGRIVAKAVDTVVEKVAEPIACGVARLSGDSLLPAIISARQDSGMSGSVFVIASVAWRLEQSKTYEKMEKNYIFDALVNQLANDYASVVTLGVMKTVVEMHKKRPLDVNVVHVYDMAATTH
jgi:hypothetical protein